MIREETLRKKGWSEKDIKQAMKILGEKRNVFFMDRFSTYIYWASLLIIIVGNLFVSVALLPFFMYLSNWMMAVVVGIIAATFGALFNILIKDIEMTDPKHHVIMSVFLPIFVLINMYVMADVANHFVKFNAVTTLQKPIFVAVIYAAGFTLPSIFAKLSLSKQKA